MDAVLQQLSEVLARLGRIEESVGTLIGDQPAKHFYSTAEVAAIVGKAEFTVREWCRLGRVRAEKRACGRGSSQEWMISREELTRFRNEGLLADPAKYRHYR